MEVLPHLNNIHFQSFPMEYVAAHDDQRRIHLSSTKVSISESYTTALLLAWDKRSASMGYNNRSLKQWAISYLSLLLFSCLQFNCMFCLLPKLENPIRKNANSGSLFPTDTHSDLVPATVWRNGREYNIGYG